jgi:type IV secretory pathway VirB6-like protein
MEQQRGSQNQVRTRAIPAFAVALPRRTVAITICAFMSNVPAYGNDSESVTHFPLIGYALALCIGFITGCVVAFVAFNRIAAGATTGMLDRTVRALSAFADATDDMHAATVAALRAGHDRLRSLQTHLGRLEAQHVSKR